MDFRPNPAVIFLIIITVIGLTVAIVLLGPWGSGQKVSIPVQANYGFMGITGFSFTLNQPTVQDDTSVLATNPLFSWPWQTGDIVMRAEIINFQPETWDANIQGGIAEVSLGKVNSIIGGTTGTGTLHFRHLQPGDYEATFALYEAKGLIFKDYEIKAGPYTFSFSVDSLGYATYNWEIGEPYG